VKIGGWDTFIEHEQNLTEFFFKQFDGLEWFKPFGPRDSSQKYGAIAFHINGFTFRGCKDINKKDNSKDGDSISRFLNEKGIAFREGITVRNHFMISLKLDHLCVLA
jgi:selenocysteine lyase/cysteine desulfurase